ncbi:MAG: hypothetical protein JXA83_02555 [Acidimicrobiales bacterium]|nr:hypothetical protein [Acidimicrobiales bacterium]
MSVTTMPRRVSIRSFVLGVVIGAAVTVVVGVTGVLVVRWFQSTFSTLKLTEAEVQSSTLNAYLESRSIAAGSSAVVIAEESDCNRWVATVRIHRPTDGPGTSGDTEIVDSATFQVNNDSGQPFPHERPGMSAEQVKASMCR